MFVSLPIKILELDVSAPLFTESDRPALSPINIERRASVAFCPAN